MKTLQTDSVRKWLLFYKSRRARVKWVTFTFMWAGVKEQPIFCSKEIKRGTVCTLVEKKCAKIQKMKKTLKYLTITSFLKEPRL